MTTEHRFIKSMTCYPVKSLRGEELESSEAGFEGFKNDRCFMVIDEKGDFITQREEAKMALIQATMKNNTLEILCPGEQPVVVDKISDDWLAVRVWKDFVEAKKVKGNVNSVLSNYLGRDCSLVKLSDQKPREISAPEAEGKVSFADAFPYLIIGTASLDYLNSKLNNPVSMDNFRPNLVIETKTPFEEDKWDEIEISGVRFKNVKLCDRCLVTTINPSTSEKYAKGEPLRTLATFRKNENNKVLFGVNFIALSTGKISRQDEVVIL